MIVPASPTFGFVIPLLHPHHWAVSDYTQIERLLKATLDCISHVRGVEVKAVIICARAPAWAPDYKDWVTFITVESHPLFVENPEKGSWDKGLKHLVGLWYLAAVSPVHLVMPMDADDFVHRDLAKHIFAELSRCHLDGQMVDGVQIKEGYEVALEIDGEDVCLSAAFAARGFDQYCGTCRVFKFDALLQKTSSELTPPMLDAIDAFNKAPRDYLPPQGKENIIGHDALPFMAALPALLEAENEFVSEMIFVVGRHVSQAPFFDLSTCRKALAAKSCGHGNQFGPKRGGMHWRKFRRFRRLTPFSRDFSLDRVDGIKLKLDVGLLMSALWRRFFSKKNYIPATRN
ncbi:MAG: hypothetical protein AAFR71_12060 [Pseudomonadota bacterium]